MVRRRRRTTTTRRKTYVRKYKAKRKAPRHGQKFIIGEPKHARLTVGRMIRKEF